MSTDMDAASPQTPAEASQVNGHAEKDKVNGTAGVPDKDAAEDFKAQGNTFFKAKEWTKAIEQYTKGNPALCT